MSDSGVAGDVAATSCAMLWHSMRLMRDPAVTKVPDTHHQYEATASPVGRKEVSTPFLVGEAVAVRAYAKTGRRPTRRACFRANSSKIRE